MYKSFKVPRKIHSRNGPIISFFVLLAVMQKFLHPHHVLRGQIYWISSLLFDFLFLLSEPFFVVYELNDVINLSYNLA